MTDSRIVIAHLNDRAQPLDRGELYEDPFDHVLKQASLGAVTGGGTQLADDGEVAFCDVEIKSKTSPRDRSRSSLRSSSAWEHLHPTGRV